MMKGEGTNPKVAGTKQEYILSGWSTQYAEKVSDTFYCDQLSQETQLQIALK
jgi:hypothetical protein